MEIIHAIARTVLEQLEKACPRKYALCGWGNTHQSGRSNWKIFYSIEWSEPVKNPALKQQALAMEIRFYDDRAVCNIMEFSMFTAYYCDPIFPNNLINYLKRNEK